MDREQFARDRGWRPPWEACRSSLPNLSPTASNDLHPSLPPTGPSPISRGLSRGSSPLFSSSPTPTSLPPTLGQQSRVSAGTTVVAGKTLTEWDADPAYTEAVRTLLGLPGVGEEFPCKLPASDGVERKGVLWTDDRGCLIYISKTYATRDNFTLTDLYASLRARRLIHLRGPSLSTWKLDLMRTVGFLQVPEITLPKLSANASAEDVKIHQRITDLFAAKAAVNPAAPAAITIGFLADFTPTTWDCARGAITRFERSGIIDYAGDIFSNGKRIRLWTPGTPT